MSAAPLKLELRGGPLARSCTVSLDGRDISHHVRGVVVSANVRDAVTAHLSLVNIEVDVNLDAVVGGVVVPLVPPGDPEPHPDRAA